MCWSWVSGWTQLAAQYILRGHSLKTLEKHAPIWTLGVGGKPLTSVWLRGFIIETVPFGLSEVQACPTFAFLVRRCLGGASGGWLSSSLSLAPSSSARWDSGLFCCIEGIGKNKINNFQTFVINRKMKITLVMLGWLWLVLKLAGKGGAGGGGGFWDWFRSSSSPLLEQTSASSLSCRSEELSQVKEKTN